MEWKYKGDYIMSRTEFLRQERDRILKQLSQGPENKAKLLTSLMDIDAEMEEMRQPQKSFAKS